MRRMESRILFTLFAMAFFYLGVFYAENLGISGTDEWMEAVRFICLKIENDCARIWKILKVFISEGERILQVLKNKTVI